MTRTSFSIAGRPLGPGHAPYVIAEMSGNHNGSLERARRLVKIAKDAGADAVKLQTYTADTITIRSTRPEFIVGDGLWKGRQLHDLYEEAHTPWAWHAELFAYAKEIGITIFSSPFDPTAVDLLTDLGAPAFKIASAEIVDFGLMEYVASKGKPVIVSTGMATDAEIGEAVTVLRQNGAKELLVLHCNSGYPTPLKDANLSRIPYLAEKFDVLVGFSDHTMGTLAASIATALGCAAFEKHFTTDRADGGIDSAFSLDAGELKEYCDGARDAFASIGRADVEVSASEAATRQFRRSLYFVKPLLAGETVTAAHVRSIRPANGLHTKHLKDLIGKKAKAAIEAGTPTDFALVE
jgi:N-acetylneuraminate synthase